MQSMSPKMVFHSITSALPRQVDDPALQKMINDNLNGQFNNFARTCHRIGVQSPTGPDAPSTTFCYNLSDTDISIFADKIHSVTIKIFHCEEYKMQLWKFTLENRSISYLLDSRTAGRSFIPLGCFLLPYFNGDEFEILSTGTEHIPEILPPGRIEYNQTLFQAISAISMYLDDPLITALEAYNDEMTLGPCTLGLFPNIVSYHALRDPVLGPEKESDFPHGYSPGRFHQHNEGTLIPQIGEKVNLLIIRNLITPARMSVEEGIKLLQHYKAMLTPDGFMIVTSSQLPHIGREDYENMGFQILNMGKLCPILDGDDPKSFYQAIYILRHKFPQSMRLTAEKVYLVNGKIETDKSVAPRENREALFKLPSGQYHKKKQRMLARGSTKVAWSGSVHSNPGETQIRTTQIIPGGKIKGGTIPLRYERALLEKLQGSEYIVNALGFYVSGKSGNYNHKYGSRFVWEETLSDKGPTSMWENSLSDDKYKETCIWENMDGGTLEKPWTHLQMQDRLKGLSSVLRGLEQLHSLGFLHLDLHAGNFLLKKSGVVKLGDLGSARPTVELSNESDLTQLKVLSQLGYGVVTDRLAPEVLENMLQCRHKIETSADIFPMGINLLNLVFKEIHPSDTMFDPYIAEYTSICLPIAYDWQLVSGMHLGETSDGSIQRIFEFGTNSEMLEKRPSLLSRLENMRNIYPQEPLKSDLMRHLIWEMIHFDPKVRPGASEAAERIAALNLDQST